MQVRGFPLVFKMTPRQKLALFLRPTMIVVAAFTVFAAAGECLSLQIGKPEPDFVAPGAVTPESLPEMGLGELIQPSPDLSPADVVRTQLAGLANPKTDGVGILQCYCFASPANRQVTGPLDRFGQMVRRQPFDCFARPHATLIGKPDIDGSLARVLVTVMDEQHRVLAFSFILSRQEVAPFENCWMTESVFPAGGVAPAGEYLPPSHGAGKDARSNEAA